MYILNYIVTNQFTNAYKRISKRTEHDVVHSTLLATCTVLN